MKDKRILLLGGEGESTNIVFHFLNEKFNLVQAIVEQPESKKVFIKRRIKKLGYLTVLGQILFQLFIVKFLKLSSGKRKKEIIRQFNLNNSEINKDKLANVSSVNHKSTIELIQNMNPDLIIVNGTRIISKKVLESTNCKFINTHAGITPKYRGVHGLYWALINNDAEHGGVTVHFVDSGIDTGNIIYQNKVNYGNKDNFTTYPFLQLAEGLNLLEKAVNDYFAEKIEIKDGPKESFLWYHPTIFQYLYYRIFKGVK